jgi:hypothetical protein
LKDDVRVKKLEDILNKESNDRLHKLLKDTRLSKPQMKVWEKIIADEADSDHVRGLLLRKKKNGKKKVKRCRCNK